MNENPRDTHFRGFAELLLSEISGTDGWSLADVEKLVARRAYDLVKHVIGSVAYIDLLRLTPDEHVERIPDLKVWPVEEKQHKSLPVNYFSLIAGYSPELVSLPEGSQIFPLAGKRLCGCLFCDGPLVDEEFVHSSECVIVKLREALDIVADPEQVKMLEQTEREKGQGRLWAEVKKDLGWNV